MPPRKNKQQQEEAKKEVPQVETSSKTTKLQLNNQSKTLDCNSDEETLEEETAKEETDNEESEKENNADDSDEESEEETKVNKKTKKPKETFKDLFEKMESNESKTKELVSKKSELEKELNTLYRERTSLLKLLSKTHNDELVSVNKEKPKRKGNVTGGFNAVTKVPQNLIDYLDLSEGAEMSRPQVAKLLHEKFKTEGLKEGSQTTLNKKTVDKLKLPKSYYNKVIKTIKKEETDYTFQTFLKEFYSKKEDQTLLQLN